MKILVTGPTGFIGSALVANLGSKTGYDVHAVSRQVEKNIPGASASLYITDLTDGEGLGMAVEGIEVVVHTAARVHIMGRPGPDTEAEYRRVNAKATSDLATMAAAAGVRRFIFLSSVKVNGDENVCTYTEADTPHPTDAYAKSKLEAECLLREISKRTGMEIVIIRPPLVYGAGVGANFSALVRLIKSGIPLPLRAIGNKRSFIGLGNLLDLVATCIEHPAAANETFLASDGCDLSTTELLEHISKALGRPARLFSVPDSALMSIAHATGQGGRADRLLGSLTVDITKARRLLSWEPPFSIEQGLAYLARESK